VPHGPGGGHDLHALLHADDLVLLRSDQRMAQLQLDALSSNCESCGLESNMSKSAAVVL
jgi:hypothetical protein